jgi:hypothetical protein
MKCTHIGLDDQAPALPGLAAHKEYACVELSEIRREWGGVLGREVSAGDSRRNSGVMLENEKPLPGEGFRGFMSPAFRKCQLT